MRKEGMHFWKSVRRFSVHNVQIIIILVALLIGLRVALPFIVKYYVNKTLDTMPGYHGHVADIDMKLWRGAYQIDGIKIVKTDGKVPVPFFAADKVEFSVQWKALFDGALVAQIEFFRPEINFVNGPTKETQQVGVDKPWNDVIKKLFPLDINKFEVHDGSVHYRDFYSKPKVDLLVDRIHMLATNLSNSKKLSKTLVATLTSTGRTFQQSDYQLDAKIDPSKDEPTFDLNFKLDPVALTKLNDFVKAYADFDFEKGTLALAIELACDQGKLAGYMKPVIDDISVVSIKGDLPNPLQLLWESTIGGILRVFRNQPHNRFATKIPIEGTLKGGLKTPILPTLGNLLKNEFIRTYESNVENVIDLRDAAGTKSPEEKKKDETQLKAVEQKDAPKQERLEKKEDARAESGKPAK